MDSSVAKKGSSPGWEKKKMKPISTIHVFLTARLVKHEMPVGLTGLNDRDFLMTLTKPMLRSCHETPKPRLPQDKQE